MTTRYSPTILRRRLGTELRRIRLERNQTCADVARELKSLETGTNWSETKISRVETARLATHPGDIADLADYYEVPGDQRDVLLTLARKGRQRGWWQVYGEALPTWFEIYVDLESEASVLRTYQAEAVPGLLQCDRYARAVLSKPSDNANEDEIDQRVALRIARQERLNGDNPLQVRAILNEAVLHRAIGGTDTLKSQLDHLLNLTKSPNISIRVLPFSAGAYPSLGHGSFNLLEFPEPADPQIAHVENLVGAMFLEKPKEIRAYTAAYEALGDYALNNHGSAKLIRQLTKDL